MALNKKEQKEAAKRYARAELSLTIVEAIHKFKASNGEKLTSDDEDYVLSQILSRSLENKI